MSLPLTILIAALSGCVSLSYEILWFRVYSFVSGGSPAAFGLLLGYYLAGLALGAYLSRAFCRTRSVADLRRQMWVLLAIAFLANLVGYLVVPSLAWLIMHVSWASSLLLVTVSAMLFGAILPLVSHLGIAPDDRAGARLSYVYLANVLGSAVGSLITGFVLLNVWSTAQMALALAFAGLGLVLGLLALARPRRIPAILGITTVATAAFAFDAFNPVLFDRLYEKLLFKERDTGERFADLVENRSGVIAVTRTLRVFGGGAYDGMISTDLMHDRNNIMRAFAAPAIHPRPRDVLMIGLSTGAWAQVIASSTNVEHLTVIEINPGYLQLIAKYPQVSSVLSNPKVTIIIDDGRRWMLQHPERRFDLVVSNTTEHWRAHVTNLLSREYLTLVRAHLRQDGVFYYNTTDSQDAYKTAFSVFPYGFRLANFVTVSDSPVQLDSARWRGLLMDYRIDGRPVFNLTNATDRNRLDSLLTLPRSINAAPKSLGLEARDSLLPHLSLAKVITDDNMIPEWRTLLLMR